MFEKYFRRCCSAFTYIILPSIILLLLTQPAVANDLDAQGCKCHQQMVAEAINKYFVHKPFKELKCLTCHSRKAEEDARFADNDFDVSQKINWLFESQTPVTVHSFLFPTMQAGNSLYIETGETDRHSNRKKITIPSLESLPLMKIGESVPAISNVHLRSIRQELFLSATISWQTDTLTNATIYYGLSEKLGQQLSFDGSYRYEHLVSVSELRENKTYYFKVASSDLSGRRTISPMATFSTKITKPKSPLANVNSSQNEKIKESIKSEFFRYGDGYVLQLTLSRPTTLYIGEPEGQSLSRRVDSVDKHPVLSSDIYTRSKVCLQCHPLSEDELGHPLHVKAPKGMVIPPEYHLLPNGEITCMSCHEAHGSFNEYRMVKMQKQALCIGCHQGMT